MNALIRLITTPFTRRKPGKEIPMPDPTNQATPPASSGGTETPKSLTAQQIQAMVTAAIAEAVKPIADQVKGLQDGLGKAATPESVAKLVADQIAAQNASQAKSQARGKRLASKLADVPEAYHAQLGDDPAKWDAEEAAIRAQFKADLEKAGVKAGNLGGDAGGKKVTDAVDTSKLSGLELISLGTKQTAAAPSTPGAAK